MNCIAKKPKRAIGNHFPHAQVKLWHGGDHSFWWRPSLGCLTACLNSLVYPWMSQDTFLWDRSIQCLQLTGLWNSASVQSPLRNVINPGSARQHQIPGCHPRRSGKAVWSLVYLWLWNVCLLRNREGIHAEESDVGLKKRQRALNSAKFAYLFH